ncbi:hypothetical protein [Kamptonema formosum]|uniref:hypothetical protein n=1 Tax=Kamptonema formosum TaxID=331992 RepID=UPI0003467F00|nr:hypothetical protein [Oscillatoria sp. PCC 10802]
MFDYFVPSSGHTWEKCLNSSFTSECGNAEPADAITPGVAIKNLPASGASGEVIDIPPPAYQSDYSLSGAPVYSIRSLSLRPGDE